MRRHFGIGLIAAGVVMLTAAGGKYAQGAIRADQARQAWEELSASAAVASARAFADHRKSGRMKEGAPVARLVIPRIDLDEIVLEGVGDSELNGGPGHVPGSAFPGEPGNSIVSAHRDRHFRRFDKVAIGDTIVTESPGKSITWVIVDRRVIDKDAPALFRTKDATLTLTTCWPIRFFGTAPDRLILTAKPVS